MEATGKQFVDGKMRDTFRVTFTALEEEAAEAIDESIFLNGGDAPAGIGKMVLHDLRDHGGIHVCGLCRDCKWWGVTSSEDVGHCRHAGSHQKGDGRVWPSWKADVYTKPDFGCVQWEAKSE